MGSARTPLGPICSFLPLNHMCNFVAQNSQKYARIDFYFIEIIPPCDFSLVLTFVHSNLCPDTVRRTKTKSKTKNITIMQICIWINMSRWFLKTSTFILNQVVNNTNNITDWFGCAVETGHSGYKVKREYYRLTYRADRKPAGYLFVVMR